MYKKKGINEKHLGNSNKRIFKRRKEIEKELQN
jgi:hypothetical protein